MNLRYIAFSTRSSTWCGFSPGPNTKNGKDSSLPRSKLEASVTPPIGAATKSLLNAVLPIVLAVSIRLF